MENKLNNNLVKISKFPNMVLRHSPQAIHVNMDKNGWVNINKLIGKN
jgi:RNA:NAD 2'-phosphotransferase (TPT1/KptA family)